MAAHLGLVELLHLSELLLVQAHRLLASGIIVRLYSSAGGLVRLLLLLLLRLVRLHDGQHALQPVLQPHALHARVQPLPHASPGGKQPRVSMQAVLCVWCAQRSVHRNCNGGGMRQRESPGAVPMHRWSQLPHLAFCSLSSLSCSSAHCRSAVISAVSPEGS